MAPKSTRRLGLLLAEKQNPTRLLREALWSVLSEFEDDGSSLGAPATDEEFKQQLDRYLPAFEAARLTHREPARLAKLIWEAMRSRIAYRSQSDAIHDDNSAAERPSLSPSPAAEAFNNKSYAPLELHELTGTADSRDERRPLACGTLVWPPEHLAAWLKRQSLASADAINRLKNLPAHRDLRGSRFVLLGAGAELSPAKLLLELGADVLYIDIKDPPLSLQDTSAYCGRLFYPESPIDLLREPAQALAQITDFAQSGPIHLGLFAYAAGGGRELLLCYAMDELVMRLDPSIVKSVVSWGSPASPHEITEEQLKRSQRRLDELPFAWKAIAKACSVREAYERAGSAYVSRSVISLQGSSYQAAQLIGKSYFFEFMAKERPGWIMANLIAPISSTRSMKHPAFQWALRGAEALGVRCFPPVETGAVMGLLWLCLIRYPQKEPAMLSIDGGVFSLPFDLQGAMKVAMLAATLPKRARLAFGPVRL